MTLPIAKIQTNTQATHPAAAVIMRNIFWSVRFTILTNMPEVEHEITVYFKVWKTYVDQVSWNKPVRMATMIWQLRGKRLAESSCRNEMIRTQP